jgi:hypothetical protein
MGFRKKLNKETITFTALDKYGFDTQDRPYPASMSIPKWWKDLTPYDKTLDNPDGKKLIVQNGISNASAKKCQPMLDAITSGYIIPLWADVVVAQTEAFPALSWRTNQPIFELHGPSSRLIPPPSGYDQVVFKYLNTWIPRTPPGYSILVSSPFGHNDLPFHAVPAVVDSDKATLELIFPMWIKTGFEGVVEHGTPMIQLTPFKRTNWTSEFNHKEDGEHRKSSDQNFGKTLVNHYIKTEWSKKDYK